MLFKVLTNSFVGSLKAWIRTRSIRFKIYLQVSTSRVQSLFWSLLTTHSHDDVAGWEAAIVDLNKIILADWGEMQIKWDKVEFYLLSTWNCDVPKPSYITGIRWWEVRACYCSVVAINVIWNCYTSSFYGGKKNKRQVLGTFKLLRRTKKFSAFLLRTLSTTLGLILHITFTYYIYYFFLDIQSSPWSSAFIH